ncbi:MAG: ATP-grasp domain-containing protein [Deltaproteobacteria bacterium]|jgi:biotin carboxylase|nr:ATP-grasp domain-containing protein [Deltaproteobacteria bacterium]
MADRDDYRKAVVIVDAVAAGLALRDEAKRQGYLVIGYQSQPLAYFEELPPSYRPPYIKDHEYYDEIVIEGDLEKGVELLKGLDLDIRGVMPGSELGVTPADFIAHKLDLRCNDPKLISARRNKVDMKRVVEKAGLRVPKHRDLKSKRDLDDFIREVSLPIVLKPPTGVGMYNISFCNTVEEAHAGFDKIIHQADSLGSVCDHVNGEEYISGIEYAADTFSDDGNIFVTDLWRYNRVDTSVARNQYRDIYMLPIDDPKYDELKEYAVDLCKALGVKYGAAHPELKVDDDGPVMMEVGCRLAGCHMPQLCRDLSNFDPMASMVKSFCGEPLIVEKPIRYKGHAWIVFCSTEKRGEIDSFVGLEEIQELNSYHEHFLTYTAGDSVSPTEDLWSNPFYVWLVHEDRDLLRRDAEMVHRLFDIKVK